MYIVEFEEGCWAAPWSGDPGRTLVKDNAKRFKTLSAAIKCLDKARAIPFRNGFRNAKIIYLKTGRVWKEVEECPAEQNLAEKETKAMKLLGDVILFLYDLLPILHGKNHDKANALIEEYDKLRGVK